MNIPLYLSRNVMRRSWNGCGRLRAIVGVALLGAFAATGALAQGKQDKQADPDRGKITPALLAGQNQDPNAQTPPQQPPAVTINFRERPKFPTDTQRLRRTPQIDGVINEGEWDPFYTVSEGPIKGVVYCNWDDNYLYIAARTDQVATLVIDVDATGDGWLRGADNLELVVGSPTETGASTLVARLLDAANAKDTPIWNDRVLDVKNIQVAYKPVNGGQAVEVAIPKSMGSLVLRSGVNLGLRVEFLPPGPAASYTPTAPFEPHLLLDATLVDARVQPASGINPHLTLSDYKCVAGQKLFATLELLNQTDMPVSIAAVQWTGLGTSVNAVDTFRQVTVPPIPGTKKLRLGYKTLLAKNLTPGSYTLAVTAELANGKQVQATASFAVVEPIQAQMSSEPNPLVIVGTTKLDLLVDTYSAVPDHFRGELELTSYPQEWELEGLRRRTLVVYGEDARSITRVRFKLSSTTPAGDYPVEAQINWNNRVWKLHTTVHVQRYDPAKSDEKPLDKKP